MELVENFGVFVGVGLVCDIWENEFLGDVVGEVVVGGEDDDVIVVVMFE